MTTAVFKNITPDLMVPDVYIAARYYMERLGFTLELAVPEGAQAVENMLEEGRCYDYAAVRRDGVFVMLMRAEVYGEAVPALKGAAVGASASFYIDVDRLDPVYQQCLANGVEVVKGPEVTWYGMKEFYIRDGCGYILGFGERIHSPFEHKEKGGPHGHPAGDSGAPRC